jgi:Fur family peroxide stress response transcriptional regulator
MTRDLAGILRSRGHKVTPQRLAIYGMLVGTKAHPSVESIYETLKGRFPTMSLATVYKNLQALMESGLVQQLSVNQPFSRYDADVEPHGHLVCLGCGRVDDLEDRSIVQSVAERCQETADFDVRHPAISLFGYCSECRSTQSGI